MVGWCVTEMERDVEEICHSLFQSNISTLGWKDWEKAPKISFKVPTFHSEIWTISQRHVLLVHSVTHGIELSVSESEDISGFWPQVNSRTFSYPPFPLLTQRYDITRDMYCTDEDICADGLFCACPYLYNVELGNLVEIVFIDLGKLCTWSLMTVPCVVTL